MWKLTGRLIIGIVIILALASCNGASVVFDEIIDYDFYYEDFTLYAFVIEEKGVIKHNEIYDKDFQCGKTLAVYKKRLKEEVDPEFLVDKDTRINKFKGDKKITEVLTGMEKIYTNDFSKVNPWLITVGQIDEDEAIEFFVGAYRPTPFFKDGTRPYFIEYKDDIFVRQWTGTYLDHLAFEDAYYEDLDMDGIYKLKCFEKVLEKGVLTDRVTYYTIEGFLPLKID